MTFSLLSRLLGDETCSAPGTRRCINVWINVLDVDSTLIHIRRTDVDAMLGQRRRVFGGMKWNESGFRPPLCTNSSLGYGLRPSTLPLGHGGSPQYWLSHVDGEETFFCFFQAAETGNRTPNSGVKGSGANHYPRAPALPVGYGWSIRDNLKDGGGGCPEYQLQHWKPGVTITKLMAVRISENKR